MGRFPSHKGHLILPRDGGWYVPDYMDVDDLPVSLVAAKRLVDRCEASGESRREPSEVAWDAPIVSGSAPGYVIYVAQAASVIGVGRGDEVRVSMGRKDDDDPDGGARGPDRGAPGVRPPAHGGCGGDDRRDRRIDGPHGLRHHRRDPQGHHGGVLGALPG